MKTMQLKCPYCDQTKVTAGHIMGHMARLNGTSKAQQEASRINGKLGGRPRIKRK